MSDMVRVTVAILLAGTGFSISGDVFADEFTYQPPGQLVAGSGTGRGDNVVYVPGMRFPIEVAPAYANSQV